VKLGQGDPCMVGPLPRFLGLGFYGKRVTCSFLQIICLKANSPFLFNSIVICIDSYIQFEPRVCHAVHSVR
jgi:hypothetical protein